MRLPTISLCAVLSACSSQVTPPPHDSGASDASSIDAGVVADAAHAIDAGPDAAMDAHVDAQLDAATDAFSDATMDGFVDAHVDADAGVDLGGFDAGGSLCPSTPTSPSPLCSSEPCAVTRDITFACSEGGFLPRIAANGSGALVTFTTNYGRFTRRAFAVSGDGASTALAVPHDDGPGIAPGAYDGQPYVALNEVAGRGIIFGRGEGFSTLEDVSADDSRFFQIHAGPVFASDGRAALVWGESNTHFVSRRSTTGAWTSAATLASPWSRFSLATDDDRVAVSYWRSIEDGRELIVDILGEGERVMLTDTSRLDTGAPIPIALDGASVLAVYRAGGVHVTSGSMTLDVPDTGVVEPSGCPVFEGGGPGGGDACFEPTTCTETGSGTSEVSYDFVGVGADRFLVYVLHHVDSDYTLERRCGGPGCWCVQTLTERRNTAELVVERIGTAGSALARTAFGRWPLGDAGDYVQMDADLATDGTLHVVLATTPGGDGPTHLRYVAIATR